MGCPHSFHSSTFKDSNIPKASSPIQYCQWHVILKSHIENRNLKLKALKWFSFHIILLMYYISNTMHVYRKLLTVSFINIQLLLCIQNIVLHIYFKSWLVIWLYKTHIFLVNWEYPIRIKYFRLLQEKKNKQKKKKNVW